MNKTRILGIAVLLGVAALAALADVSDVEDDLSGPSGDIITKYLQAAALQPGAARSELVDIDASVPSLQEHGRLRALRKISQVGLITYRVLGFQGDNTVKKEVIARYLQAEQQGQGDAKMAIAPANYKFKLKGTRKTLTGADAYVFQISPRKKRMGLFKGELWLDAHSYLPVLEKGRLVRNPSIFFKKVDFERAFAIHNGISRPERMSSTIDTRIVGKVQLNVNYSSVPENSTAEDFSEESAPVVLKSASLP